ncbi:MAG: helix-turn-helix domain-containing protein [Firmicutes bacterium]|nr:helix-turn-helix domain-containing protein [Bacillota bacterium]
MESFAEILIRIQEERGLSQKQLAEKLGVSCSSIKRWESSISKPTLSIFCKLVRFFELTAKYFLGA